MRWRYARRDAPGGDPIRGLIERFEVALDVLGIGQLTRGADDSSEELERSRHRARSRCYG